jgi:hypothetical protein
MLFLVRQVQQARRNGAEHDPGKSFQVQKVHRQQGMRQTMAKRGRPKKKTFNEMLRAKMESLFADAVERQMPKKLDREAGEFKTSENTRKKIAKPSTVTITPKRERPTTERAADEWKKKNGVVS